jgi:hypothetical protein
MVCEYADTPSIRYKWVNRLVRNSHAFFVIYHPFRSLV